MTSLTHLHKANIGKSRRKRTNKKGRTNAYWLICGITLIGIIVIFQSFRWQIFHADKFKDLSEEQYKSTQISIAPRGKITAADGTVLAVDEPVWNIYATLSKNEEERELFFEKKEAFVSEVSGILGIEREKIDSKLTEDFVYAPLQKQVSTEKKKALENMEIFGPKTKGFGLYFEREEKRIYPNDTLAAHVLGFIGKDSEGKTIGQYGIQGYYFGDINGRSGYSYEEKDSYGNVILTSEYQPVLPREGKDFKLTILPNLQSKAEKILEEEVKKTRAKSGSVIIMDPKTGAILVMANFPTYSPGEYWRAPENSVLKNKAISDVYEYGSIQKPLTISIALDSKVIDKDFRCNDKTGYLDLFQATGYADLKGSKVYTWNKKAAGNLDIAEIFKTSNNPCTAQVALKINAQEYYSKLQEFGLGKFIGIGLQDESTNYLKPFDYWTKLDVITSSYGQGISATALQAISAFSVFANDGVRMRPYIIEEIKDENETIKIKPQVLSQPITKESAHIIRQALYTAVQRGSLGGLVKELKHYPVGVKTGTAQIAKGKEVGYKTDYTNDTVVGFAPLEDPKMIMLVRLEEPQTAGFSSLTTAPLWEKIFLTIADDMEIKRKN
ncbi:MAG TPA: penicillin-binding protein 2 [Candidatus Pacearchaeota archaeon]|nr:penicillin-binding protein 2 [Candidatus Pacearchaeota archaeon]